MLYTKNQETIIDLYEPFCQCFEGDIHHFYLDTGGGVTVGRGFYINDKSALPAYLAYFYTPDKTRRATLQEVEDDFDKVKKMPPGYGPSAYNKDKQRLWFSDEGIKYFIRPKIVGKYKALQRGCAFFNDIETPLPAKLVLLDMAYQSGEGYFLDNNASSDLAIMQGKKTAVKI